MSQVIPLRASVANHAALCEVLIMALSREVRCGRMLRDRADSVLLRASQRDCGVLRATIENILAPRESRQSTALPAG